jgi:SAM-dependent methyltransferase
MLVAPLGRRIRDQTRVVDPACGAGDLLLAAADTLPRGWGAERRWEHLAEHFLGVDIVPELVEAARLRLALACSDVRLGASRPSASDAPVRTGDSLRHTEWVEEADIVLLNPPYARRRLEEDVPWGVGLQTQAAFFMHEMVRLTRPGTHIAAILPDVLRAGPRYERWRTHISAKAEIHSAEPVGVFDSWTDIDVFILRAVTRSASHPRRRKHWHADTMNSIGPESKTLGDVASVAIGDVVPHRHKDSRGPVVAYITVKEAPADGRATVPKTRRFAGRLHAAPFLVVRRTSAPTRGQGARLRPTFVPSSLGQVAVENHLVVIRPNDSTEASCRALAIALRHPSVTDWLDDAVRTRHLTSSALLSLPVKMAAAPIDDSCTNCVESDSK